MTDAIRQLRDAATRLTLVALVTGAWLVLLDRLGHAIAGIPTWCGAACTFRVASVHVVAALLMSAVVLSAGRVIGRLQGWRWHVALALVSAFVMLATSVAFSYTVRTRAEIEAQPFLFLLASAVAGIGGVVITCIALLRAFRVFPVLLALGSLAVGIIDATIYPGQVPDIHLGLYVIQAGSSCVGLGVPLAQALRSRPLHRPAAWALMAAMLLGYADTWLRERAPTASASRVARRLLHAVPKRPPGHALGDALQEPPRAADASASGPPRVRLPLSVLLVTVDSLRADALLPTPVRGPYLKGDETPFLDAWLSTTTRFVNAYSSGPVTLESMFGLLRGVSVGDGLGGADIPALSRSLGMSTAAIVPWFFGMDEHYGASVEEFDRVDVYDVTRQETQMAALDEALSELEGERFFVWTHFFCTHLPYCGGGRPLSYGLKSPFDVLRLGSEYRQAVTWLDAQMRHIVDTLTRTKRAGSTIIVLASDHGEHLGEGLVMGHGDALHDLDIHVPLAIYVPGMPGRVVRSLASNAQILPTLVDLLGEPPAPAHTARSLLPSMVSRLETSTETVYARGVAAWQHAVVTEQRFLLYDEAVEAFAWFAREPGLVDGRADVLPLGREEERAATALLVRANPEPFLPALGDARTLGLVRARLLEVNAATRSEDVDFLLRLAAHVAEPALAPALERVFEIAPSPERKVRAALQLEPRNRDHWRAKLGDLLGSSIGTASEIPVLGALTAYGLSGIAARPDLAVRPATLSPAHDPPLISAWLELLGSGENHAPALAAIRNLVELTAPDGLGAEGTRRALLAVATLSLEPAGRASAEARDVARWVRPHLDSRERALRLGASRALGKVGTEEDVARLTRVTDSDPSTGVRKAARMALDLLSKKPPRSAVAPGKAAR